MSAVQFNITAHAIQACGGLVLEIDLSNRPSNPLPLDIMPDTGCARSSGLRRRVLSHGVVMLLGASVENAESFVCERALHVDACRDRRSWQVLPINSVF